MGAKEAIDLYEKGEPWFDVSGKEGFILDDVAKMTYSRYKQSHGNLYETGNEDLFAHLVVGHFFIEFLNITGIRNYTDSKKSKEESDEEEFYGSLRKIYDNFVEVNEIPEDVRELGWEEFIND